MRFKDKIVMVTGGAAGIGRVTAEAFAREGAKLAICDVNPETGEAAAKFLGAEASFEKVDVANETAVSEWTDQVVKRYGRIDVLVNNAGITRDALLLRMKAADWDLVMNINLKGRSYARGRWCGIWPSSARDGSSMWPRWSAWSQCRAGQLCRLEGRPHRPD